MLVPADKAPETIVLKGELLRRYEEGRAAGAIKPGHLVQRGSAGTFTVHSTSSGVATPVMFAIEDALQGKTIDDAYASGDLLRYFIPQPGDVIYAWLKAGENVAIGDTVLSGGDGTLIKTTGTVLEGARVGQVEEALDLSGGGAVATRIRVRIG